MILILLQIPPFRDLAKWNNRMLSNLLYYQTNYFAFMLLIILICASVQLRDIFIGLVAIISVVTVLIFSLSSNPTFVQVGRLVLFILMQVWLGSLYLQHSNNQFHLRFGVVSRLSGRIFQITWF